ncbi:hypothetical protein KFE25_011498 [Diacronema lutheri]|uniref:Uncharacterized protein n=1 Tax=Diacronema lutheri TaxID=2081491 RepID=A0A8J5X8Z2_DIALT|nr:hypothetical protein KFE25_011498 [Diacronema lutheri]
MRELHAQVDDVLAKLEAAKRAREEAEAFARRGAGGAGGDGAERPGLLRRITRGVTGGGSSVSLGGRRTATRTTSGLSTSEPRLASVISRALEAARAAPRASRTSREMSRANHEEEKQGLRTVSGEPYGGFPPRGMGDDVDDGGGGGGAERAGGGAQRGRDVARLAHVGWLGIAPAADTSALAGQHKAAPRAASLSPPPAAMLPAPIARAPRACAEDDDRAVGLEDVWLTDEQPVAADGARRRLPAAHGPLAPRGSGCSDARAHEDEWRSACATSGSPACRVRAVSFAERGGTDAHGDAGERATAGTREAAWPSAPRAGELDALDASGDSVDARAMGRAPEGGAAMPKLPPLPTEISRL